MKLTVISSSAMIFAGFLATGAHAFEFSGANADLSYFSGSGGGGAVQYDTAIVAGSAAFGFGGGFGGQLDIANITFSGDVTGVTSAVGLHLTYQASPSTVLGVFYNQDSWFYGDIDPHYGVEVAFDPSGGGLPITVEAFWGRYDFPGGNGTILGASGSYAINDNWSLLLGGIVSDWTTVSRYTMATIGARYDFGSGLYLSGDASAYALNGMKDTAIGVQIGWDIGGGAVFSRRSSPIVFNGR